MKSAKFQTAGGDVDQSLAGLQCGSGVSLDGGGHLAGEAGDHTKAFMEES